jgi:hypothetical protein
LFDQTQHHFSVPTIIKPSRGGAVQGSPRSARSSFTLDGNEHDGTFVTSRDERAGRYNLCIFFQAQQNRSKRRPRHCTDDAAGWFRAVHVKNIEMQKKRTLLANRKPLKRKLVDIENHIRGSL